METDALPDAVGQDRELPDLAEVDTSADLPTSSPTDAWVGAPADAKGDAARDSAQSDLPPPDASVPDTVVVPSGCGTGIATVEGIAGAEGIAIDDDGMIYFSASDAVNGYVGRLPLGGTPEKQWLRIDNKPATRGLALDRTRQRLYVLLGESDGALLVFENLRTTVTKRTVVASIDHGNDVVVDADGTVYFSQQVSDHIFAVPPEGGATIQVTTSIIGPGGLMTSPAGLAFDPAGALMVGSADNGLLYRLTLSGRREVARATVSGWTGGWANGLTFDRRGRLYLAIWDDEKVPKSVFRLESNGSLTTITNNGQFASIAFGRGGLDCRDLYIPVPQGTMRRVRVPDAL